VNAGVRATEAFVTYGRHQVNVCWHRRKIPGLHVPSHNCHTSFAVKLLFLHCM